MPDSIEQFTHRATAWLAQHGEPIRDREGESAWGSGEFSVAVFHDLDFDHEQAVLADAQRWHGLKSSEGYHAITSSPEGPM